MRISLLFVILALVFVQCGSPYKPLPEQVVFKYNESAGISSLDPAFARDQANIWACNQLFNGLVQLDSNLNVRPSLAKSWEIKQDGRQYVFNLRTDVYFHDWEGFPKGKGRKMSAQDVVYSLKRVLDVQTLSPGAVWLKNLLIESEDAIQLLDDSTVSIRLKKPFSPFLGRLSMAYFGIVPQEAVESYGDDFGRHPVGTGPFYFKMYEEGVKLILLKNRHYFEYENGVQLPFIDAVSISFIIDKQSVFLEFVKGNLDFLSGIDPSYKDELLMPNGKLNPKYSNTLKLQRKPYLNTEYLGFMMDADFMPEDSPLAIKEVRQAINYAFDRKKMLRYMRNNIGVAGEQGMVPPGMPGFGQNKISGFSYNPARAKFLLDSVHYFDRAQKEITLSTTSSYVDIAKYIQQQMGELGVDMKIEVNQPAALRQMIANNKIPWFRGSWIGDYADAENYLALFYSKNMSPKGANYTHFYSAEYDRLYEMARQESVDSLRWKLYRKMDAIIMEEAPVVVLYYDEVMRFTHQNISGLGINAMNILDLRRVRKSN